MKKRYTLEQKKWDSPAEHPMPEHSRVPASLAIGSVRIAPATVLAPMAGVTDTVFRRFIKNASMFASPTQPGAPCLASDTWDRPSPDVNTSTTNQQSGCGLIMTEFTSADGLSRMRESKRKRYLTYYDDEHPISAQLFGSNPETLADSARIVQDSGFDLVDLNLGCPAKRVVSCNGGSGLLRDLPQIERIFRAIRAAVTIPFTVKFRMGWNDHHIVCVELAKLAEDCGLNAVALHARTREDGYTGQARWEYIAACKDAVSIPVIGNGDIRTPEDAAAMVDATHCDAVMIGRAAPANPWIFRQIAQYTASKEATGVGSYDIPTDSDRYRMIRTYFQMLVDEIAIEEAAEAERAEAIVAAGQVAREKRNRDAVGKMKQFAAWFTHGVPNGAHLRKAIFDARSGPAVLTEVERFFESRASDPQPEFALEPDAELESAPAAWG
jgi:nifR3 family TIM-barrel protein